MCPLTPREEAVGLGILEGPDADAPWPPKTQRVCHSYCQVKLTEINSRQVSQIETSQPDQRQLINNSKKSPQFLKLRPSLSPSQNLAQHSPSYPLQEFEALVRRWAERQYLGKAPPLIVRGGKIVILSPDELEEKKREWIQRLKEEEKEEKLREEKEAKKRAKQWSKAKWEKV